MYFELVLTVSVVLSCTAYSHNVPNSLSCSSNVITPGITYPRGDITLEVGSNLTILCMLNETHPDALNRNASHLLFYNGTKPVSSDKITILNKTTIELDMFNVSKSKSNFYCKLKYENNIQKGVCLNMVYVDTKPQPVTDFNCVSHNWQNLTCSWKKPHNYVTTNYELKFRLGGPGASKRNYITCPLETATNESCFWNFETDPMYKQQDAEYFFYFHGRNQFGDWYRKDIKFYHFQNVVPSPPINLRVLDKSAHSVTITWSPQLPMDIFPPGIVHRVAYQSMWDNNDKWIEVDTSMLPLKGSQFNLTIDNLAYAHTHYDIRVWMKSAKAKDSDQLWSQHSTITFKTLSTEPYFPPITDIGSFQIEKGKQGKRNIYLYWQQIPEYYYNGQNFTTLVTQVNPYTNLETTVVPHEQTNTYAKLNDLLEESEYNFKLYSINSNGKSNHSAKIIIPRKSQLLPEPVSFTKIAYGHQTHELSWIPPKKADFSSMNYTIFWCSNDRDRPYQCSGFLNWTHISGNSIAQNITVPDDKLYQFAISMNSRTESSGMVWSICTVIHNKFSSKMSNVYIKNVGSSSILVAWQLECSDRVGVVKGFIVYYCPVSTQYDPINEISTKCGEKEQSREIHDASGTQFNVTGLHAYTTYKLSVAVLTSDGPGEPSDYILNLTHAAAPSRPPEIVQVHHITNTSATFTWEKPNATERNGKLHLYEICAISSHHSPRCIQESEDTSEQYVPQQTATISNLDPYTKYTLKIRAFTNAWSAFSSGFEFSTDIGNPVKMHKPLAEYVNASATHVRWSAPAKPNGLIQGYQVKINYFNSKTQFLDTVCHGKNKNCTEMIHLSHALRCEDRRPTVQIRAYNLINLNGKSMKLYGEWSDTQDLQCTDFDLGAVGKILYFMIFFICISPFLYYLGKMLHEKCKKAKSLSVKLPPGLDLENTKDPKTPQLWSPADDMKPPIPADEEYLIRPTRTPNRSESENESERISLGSNNTRSSECHQTSTCEGSELEVCSTASTPPMQPYQTHTKPIESKTSSYVIIGTNEHLASPTVNEDLDDIMYNALEVDDVDLPADFLSHLDRGLMSIKFLPELKYPEPTHYQKYSEPCHTLFPQATSQPIVEESRVKNLVISTSPQIGTTTTCTTSGYQTSPLPSSFNSVSKPIETKVTSPSVSSAIVINKGSSGYVTVSTASVGPHNSCV